MGSAGGWVDMDISVAENTVKEVREEAGLEVRADPADCPSGWGAASHHGVSLEGDHRLCPVYSVGRSISGESGDDGQRLVPS